MDLQKLFEKVFGSHNDKVLKQCRANIPQINAREEELQELSEEELKAKFSEWRTILTAEPHKVDEMLLEVFAGIKAAARKLCGKEFEVRGKMQTWQMVHYDVQLIGGMVLHQGNVAEMKTGEGKTLVCTLPVILNALTGKGVHVVTVNDYLAQRDAEWMQPLYEFCGLSVNVIVHGKTAEERREAYNSDITYGTNNEFGFDYLRDNMAQRVADQVQREKHFAIVDEVDSILIDEARTPLIISAPAQESTEKYTQYSKLVPILQRETDFTIDEKMKTVALTPQGITKLEKQLGIDNIYTDAGFDEVHHIENALKAHIIFEKDRDYVVNDGQVIIVDEFTGRLMPGRRYSDGLHQALEAKENADIQRESKTLATITFQNYFRLYDKLSGMTGTAETEAEEFAKIYALDTVVIPTNRPIQRKDLSDKIFKNERGKFTALVEETAKLHAKRQPVLIGTISIEKSEALSIALKNAGIPHEVLNAKQHEREAEIVANAGQLGAVTIATNMAGRGTDIKLGEGVLELGGLAILGTERHESRRIDNQLRGRAGRQGDHGFTQFYVSMRDELMRRFGGERMAGMMEKLGIDEKEAIENKMISKSVENAQKKIEAFHFDARKHVVQYDDVMNVHREKIYGRRHRLLHADDITGEITEMAHSLIETLCTSFCPRPQRDSHWDTTELVKSVNTLWQTAEMPLQPEALEKINNHEELIATLKKEFITRWEKKLSTYPEEQKDEIVRYVILRSIDELWLNHINEMTCLRDRVALSGYAQRDPVMEYKKEAYLMFEQLLQNLRRTAITNLFRVQFNEPIQMETADYSNAQTNEDQIEQGLETGEYGAAAQRPEKFASTTAGGGQSIIAAKLGKKYENVGRNDECPCGSGKKFKKCHGKNL